MLAGTGPKALTCGADVCKHCVFSLQCLILACVSAAQSSMIIYSQSGTRLCRFANKLDDVCLCRALATDMHKVAPESVVVVVACYWSKVGGEVAGSSEERMMQLLRLINSLLEKHPESRSRRLAAHAPIIVPVYSQVRSPLQHKCPISRASYCSSHTRDVNLGVWVLLDARQS